MTDDLVRTSRFLSYVLRHHPGAIGVQLDEAGWVDVDTLLAALARHGRPVTPDLFARVVAGTDKRRFQLEAGRIRAAQGHSVPVDLRLTPVPPPAAPPQRAMARNATSTGHRPQRHLSGPSPAVTP